MKIQRKIARSLRIGTHWESPADLSKLRKTFHNEIDIPLINDHLYRSLMQAGIEGNGNLFSGIQAHLLLAIADPLEETHDEWRTKRPPFEARKP